MRLHQILWPTVALVALSVVVVHAGEPYCPGDVNGDLRVDINDLGIILANMNCVGGGCPGDADGDGNTNINDLGIVLANYNTNCFVDLDIDSDNTNGTGPPDRTVAEDSIEASANEPGKFILVNDDDDDRDGTPDKDQVGAIAAEQDDLVPMVLEITPPAGGPPEIAYRLSYDAAQVRVWRSPTRGTVGTDDVPPQQVEPYTVGSPVSLWVEALSPSSVGGDVAISAEADSDDDGSFDSTDAVACTSIMMAVSPTSGILGAALDVNISRSVPPVEFDEETTGSWIGVFHPEHAVMTPAFTVDHPSALIRETSGTSAFLVLGDGQIAAGDPGLPGLEGSLRGTLGLTLGNVTLARQVDFQITDTFTYVHGVQGAGAEVASPPILDPTNPNWGDAIDVTNAVTAHVLLAILAEKNSVTSTSAPTALLVDLVSLDEGGVEIDRASLTAFLEQSRDDFGPTRLVWYSDWESPIVFVSEPVPEPDGLIILVVDPQGAVFPAFRTEP